MNFLDLLNALAKVAKPAHLDYKPVESLDIPFTQTDIDSLDGLLILMFMSMVYDIDDELGKDFNPTTPQELYDFCQQHKKRDPESIEWAVELCK
jgi:hypothetical protein